MPDMVGTLGGHDASARWCIRRVRLWVFFQDAPNRRYPCGQKTHPYRDINILSSIVCITMPLKLPSDEA